MRYHATRYFEIFGNRAIYHDGWLAGLTKRGSGSTAALLGALILAMLSERCTRSAPTR